MKKCPFCGADIEESARFCLYCMQSLTEKEQIPPHQKKKPRRLPVIVAIVIPLLTLAVVWFSRQIASENRTPSDTLPVSDTSSVSDTPPVSEHAHTPTAVTENYVEATCTQMGSYDEVVYCFECQEEISRTQKILDKKPHNHNLKVITAEYLKTAATYTKAAVYYYSCVCGDKGTATFTVGSALEHVHTFTQKNTALTYRKSPATCTEYAAYYYSCLCGEKGTSSFFSGSMLPHTEGEWTIDNMPTANEHGSKHIECTVCNKKLKEERILATGFSVGLSYSINDDGISCTVTGIGTCSETEIVIPTEINGMKVTGIGDSAFFGCNFTSITISDRITGIGDMAFSHCSNLESITILSKTVEIYDNNDTIPDSATIYGYAGSTAEAYATKYGRAFLEPREYVSDSFGENLTWTLNLDTGLLIISGDGNMYDYGEYDPDLPWDGCRAYIKRVVIENGVRSIGGGAFGVCYELDNVIIPDSVTSIGNDAFYECTSLTSITIPDSVTSIGEGAFSYCPSLTSITIPNSVTNIGDYALYCSSLTTINYCGSEAQWQAITKASNWVHDGIEYTITYNYKA